MTKLIDKVKNGATYLDSTIPGWYNYVDTKVLDIHNGERCVLGQIATKKYGFTEEEYGTPYIQLCDNLGVGSDYSKQANLGFFSWQNADCEMLTEFWKDEVNARREETSWTRLSRKVFIEESVLEPVC